LIFRSISGRLEFFLEFGIKNLFLLASSLFWSKNAWVPSDSVARSNLTSFLIQRIDMLILIIKFPSIHKKIIVSFTLLSSIVFHKSSGMGLQILWQIYCRFYQDLFELFDGSARATPHPTSWWVRLLR